MGFNLTDIRAVTEAGKLKGVQTEIACECWFTSQGRTIPKLIKIMDSEGVIHSIDSIQVFYSEEKNYSGIKTIEHLCNLKIGNMEYTVKLIFKVEECKWVIIMM